MDIASLIKTIIIIGVSLISTLNHLKMKKNDKKQHEFTRYKYKQVKDKLRKEFSLQSTNPESINETQRRHDEKIIG